jgi:group I intron endonuclease
MKVTKLSFHVLPDTDCKYLSIKFLELSRYKIHLEKRGGVYKITCLATNKFYIGSTKNFYKRFIEHRSKLKANTHCNKKLKYSFNKYSEKNFIFEILENVSNLDRKNLINLEQLYLDKYFQSKDKFRKNSLNIKPIADGGYNSSSGVRKDLRKKILVFDLNMNFIEQIYGVIETQKKYKVSGVSSCCKGKISRAGNYIFRYHDSLNIIFFDNRKIKGRKLKINPNRAKKVYQYNLNGEFIKEWRCAKEASLSLNIPESCIRKNTTGKQKTVNKFIFSFIFKNKINNIKSPKINRFELYDINNNFIKSFNSSKEAANELGFNRDRLYDAVNDNTLLLKNGFKIKKVYE